MGTGLKTITGRLWRDRSGATSIEYGLIGALIFLVILTAANMVGSNTVDMWNTLSGAIVSAIDG